MKMVSITAEDNGRGIPVEFIKKEGVSALEVVMTKIVLEESLIKILIKFQTHGVSVNALSNHLLRLPSIVVMVKCINKNTKRKNAIPVKQIGETTKEEQ
jgi:DNA gyrase subunit B